MEATYYQEKQSNRGFSAYLRNLQRKKSRLMLEIIKFHCVSSLCQFLFLRELHDPTFHEIKRTFYQRRQAIAFK